MEHNQTEYMTEKGHMRLYKFQFLHISERYILVKASVKTYVCK